MKIVITEPQYRKLMDGGLIPHPNYVSQVLNGLGEWMYKPSGLDLEKAINNILKPLKSKIGKKEIEKYINGANILFKNKKIDKWLYGNFVNNLKNEELVYDENREWHPVNKLCTNYTDLSVLLTDFLFDSLEKGGIASKQILETINKGNKVEIKDILKINQSSLFKKFIQTYSESPKELLGYIGNSIGKSEIGERLEDEVRDKLMSPPYSAEILYQGGSGDFIDMKFSIDLIVKFPNGTVNTIQVKSNESQVTNFINNKSKNKAVDLVIWPGRDENNKPIYNVKYVKDGKIQIIR
jgi:hypothetical protein